MSTPRALLLDLDGVLVLETPIGDPPRLELLRLHRNLDQILSRLGAPIFVITHRSRREARWILHHAGLMKLPVERCFTANDIVGSAIRFWRVPTLLRQGLRKRLILPALFWRFGIEPAQVCFIDDRPENVADMRQGGVLHAFVAPNALGAGVVTTFDFEQVLDLFCPPGEVPSQVALRPRQQAIESWCRTGIDTRDSARGLFNRVRRLGRLVRGTLS